MRRFVVMLMAAILMLGMGFSVCAQSAAPEVETASAIDPGSSAAPAADPKDEAFPVGSDAKKNTSSAGGVIMMLVFAVCLFFVVEAVVHFIFKTKRHQDERRD